MERVKVLHIIKSLGRGGAEMLLPETLALHNKDNFEFYYVYFLPWKDQMVKEIEAQGGNVTCLPAKNNLQIIFSVKKLVRYIRKHRIKLIHCHLPWAGIVGRLAGIQTGIPVLYTEHNKWERYHRLTYFLNKITFGKQRMAIAVSGEVAQSIRKFYSSSRPEIRTILNGVNTQKFARSVNDRSMRLKLGIVDDAVVIGTVSVFRLQKRLDKWLEVAHEVHMRHPNTYFIVVGDGPLREEIEQKAAALNMSSYLHFAGLQENVRPYFNAMDVFMMASRFEGLPIALLEAMSMECIPVCTKAGGIPEVINHGVDGLLCDVDEPGNLAVEMDRLLANFGNLQPVLKGAARKKIIERFSLRRMVTELEEAYYSVLK